jgi:sugar lactone lactonase YvrE
VRAEPLTGVVTDHGEGAGWDPARGVVTVVDLLAGDLVDVHDDGRVERRHVGSVAAAWRPRTGGGTVVATERGFLALDASGAEEWSVEAFDDPALRMNEGGCDPQGRFLCGSMAYAATPGAGVLWRVDPDRTVHRVRAGLTIPNGLVWSASGAEAFHVDTPTGRIDRWAYDAATGELSERRTVATVEGGGPDGMTIDADGGLWVALWGGHAVHRYDQTGALTEVVEVGAAQVTSCAFAGPDLDRLVVTTSRHGLVPGADPLAGAVFAVEPGVAGAPRPEFGG